MRPAVANVCKQASAKCALLADAVLRPWGEEQAAIRGVPFPPSESVLRHVVEW